MQNFVIVFYLNFAFKLLVRTIILTLCSFQITAIIDTFKYSYNSQDEYGLQEDDFRSWLQDEDIIKLVLDSNQMDKQVVCEGTSKIVSFLGECLQGENLNKLWDAQVRLNISCVFGKRVRRFLTE